MGILNWLRGIKPAPGGVKRQPVKKLRAALLAIDGPKTPFRVRDGEGEGVDLVAEWKIVDAKWYEIFAAAGLKRVFTVLMKFDEAKGEVRAVEREWEVEWRAGEPILTLRAEAFRGRKWEKSFETVYAFREDGSFGKIYDYRFDSNEIKGPLIAAAHKAGWGWRGVAFAKL